MVGLSPTRGHQFISDLFRKGNVHEVVTMHMADFSPPQAIFRASKAVWLGGDPRPTLQSGVYSFFGP